MDQRSSRRLRSGAVVLGGMGMLAATLVACGSDPDKRCADRVTLEKLPRSECKSGGRGSYYYGGSVGKNGKLSGGGFDKSAVKRGGFGKSGSGSKGG